MAPIPVLEPAVAQRVDSFRQPASGCGPIVIGPERHAEPLVRYPQIAVATDRDTLVPAPDH